MLSAVLDGINCRLLFLKLIAVQTSFMLLNGNFNDVCLFVCFSAMLMYRTCRCCRRIWSKLLHTTFHLLAAPCIAIGFVAVYDYHNDRRDKFGNPDPIPHFYSIHSWMGLTTMGLFALQVLILIN